MLLPYLPDLVDTSHGLGVPVLLHSCGHILAYLPDLAQTHASPRFTRCSAPPGWTCATIKEQYGSGFCLIGNIDSSRTLPFGTPDEVAAEVREAIAIAAPGGGYVLASDHSLHDGIPLENILALRDAGLEFGRRVYETAGSESIGCEGIDG